MQHTANFDADILVIDSLNIEILPGGCTEPVIHWGGAILLVVELLRSSPAY
ncbi:hypothetical protein [Sphingomonas zeae]